MRALALCCLFVLACRPTPPVVTATESGPLLNVASQQRPPPSAATSTTATTSCRAVDPEVALTPRSNIGRTLRLLQSSTPSQRHHVRILFYGQSFTEGAWVDAVMRWLAQRYPDADLELENRALGGYASQLLVNDAESALYPFQPDLIIFHVFGAHDRYEDIIRRIRERTTSELLIQNDPLLLADELNEPTDPTQLPLGKSPWGAFMNYVWLPTLAQRYNALLCDQRGTFKRNLAAQHLTPAAVSSADAHPNALGNRWMSEIVESCLAPGCDDAAAPAETWVRTLPVTPSMFSADGTLRLAFVGNRIDAIGSHATSNATGAAAAATAVSIDGKAPSQFPELYGFSRVLAEGAGKWPILYGLGSQSLRVVERFTLELTKLSTSEKQDAIPIARTPDAKTDARELYSFELRGERTGFEGRGRSDRHFVSNSGRVVIDPENFVVAYALQLGQVQPVPTHVRASFEVEPYFVDSFTLPAPARAGSEIVVTLAHGLSNAPHLLELRGGELGAISALRVYQPPLAAAH